jgi:hypothetical protein
MAHQLEAGIINKVQYIFTGSRKEIIHAEHIMAVVQ